MRLGRIVELNRDLVTSDEQGMKRELISVSIGLLAEASQVKLIHKRNRHTMCALFPHTRVLSDE